MTSGVIAWHLGVSIVLVAESLALAMKFFLGLWLREMPCFKWFLLVSMLNRKKSFIFSSLFVGNSESIF